MKKFGKFLFGTITVASIAAGAYYLYKNYIKKDSSDDFDDFEDDFEDFDTEDDADTDSREYVSIHFTSDADAEDTTLEVTVPDTEDKDEAEKAEEE